MGVFGKVKNKLSRWVRSSSRSPPRVSPYGPQGIPQQHHADTPKSPYSPAHASSPSIPHDPPQQRHPDIPKSSHSSAHASPPVEMMRSWSDLCRRVDSQRLPIHCEISKSEFLEQPSSNDNTGEACENAPDMRAESSDQGAKREIEVKEWESPAPCSAKGKGRALDDASDLAQVDALLRTLRIINQLERVGLNPATQRFRYLTAVWMWKMIKALAEADLNMEEVLAYTGLFNVIEEYFNSMYPDPADSQDL